MKAIETTYAGCRFRSRLEARWAVFMDTMHIPWQYEAEGFLLDHDKPYLPDFYLPNTDTWVEVKPSVAMMDWDVLAAMDYGKGVRGMYESVGTDRGLACLFDVPDPHRAIAAIPVLQHHEGLWWSQGFWTPKGIEVYLGNEVWFNRNEDPPHSRWKVSHGPLARAFEVARSARFSGGRGS